MELHRHLSSGTVYVFLHQICVFLDNFYNKMMHLILIYCCLLVFMNENCACSVTADKTREASMNTEHLILLYSLHW